MRTSKHLALLLVVVLCATMFAPLAMADGTRVQPREVVNHRVFSSEEDAGILTDEASARIKRIIQEQGIVDIDALLEPFFRNCVRGDETIIGSARAIPNVGDSRYKIYYEGTGLIRYNRKGGIWNFIKDATISTVLGSVKKIGTILSLAYSAIGYEPDYEELAAAETLYSYRYIKEAGQVYYHNGSAYAYSTRAQVISRETYLHELGYYTALNGLTYTKTFENNKKYAKYEPAPHAGLMTWIKDKAVYHWKNDLASYYEDWND